jgi:MFS transporter, AAHS family, 4-hydroxybenzoate transporter
MNRPEIELNVNEQIDRAPVGRLQWVILALSLLAMILEGYDTFTVGYVGSQIAAAFAVSPSKLGVVFTSGIIGSAVGYLVVGPIADRYGRRNLILTGTFAFGLLTLISIAARSFETFVAIRTVAGVALGVVLPNVVALVAEMAPTRWRSLSVVILYSGFAIGSAVGGLLAADLVPLFGWRSVLVAGGVAPIGLALLMWGVLPESIRFLAIRDPGDPRLRRTLARIAGSERIPPNARFTLLAGAGNRQPVMQLFTDGRALPTLLIWMALSMNGAAITTLLFWIPTLTAKAGVGAGHGINFTVILLLGGTLGAYAIGYSMDRVGAYRVLIPVHLCATLSIVVFGIFVTAASLPLGFLIGLTLPGGTSGVQGLLARLYPTFLRATGIGWAVGVGRLAGIAAPLLTGLLLSRGLPPGTILIFCGCLVLISTASLIGMSLGRRSRWAVLAADAS